MLIEITKKDLMKFKAPRHSQTMKHLSGKAPGGLRDSVYVPVPEILGIGYDEGPEQDFKERMFRQTIRKARRSSLMEESKITLLSQNTIKAATRDARLTTYKAQTQKSKRETKYRK